MITKLEDAKKIVLDFFNPDPNMEAIGDEYIIVDMDTLDKGAFRVFRVTSRVYLETGNRKHKVTGLGPVILEKKDGSVHTLGGGVHSRKTWISIYEAETRPSLVRSIKSNFNIIVDEITGRAIKDYL